MDPQKSKPPRKVGEAEFLEQGRRNSAVIRGTTERDLIAAKMIRQEEALRHAHDLVESFAATYPVPSLQRWAREILSAIEAGL